MNREAPAKYRADWPKARADAVDKVCAENAAEEVRVTWLDYQGDRLTELLVCPIRAG